MHGSSVEILEGGPIGLFEATRFSSGTDQNLLTSLRLESGKKFGALWS